MKVMITAGGDYHPAQEIAMLFQGLLRDLGADVTTVTGENSSREWRKLLTGDFDVILNYWTMLPQNEETKKDTDALTEAVHKRLVAYVGPHNGSIDWNRWHEAARVMCGGQFDGHPGGNIDYWVYVIGGHPITNGLEGAVQMKSTEFYLGRFSPEIDVLANAMWPVELGNLDGRNLVRNGRGIQAPCIWTKKYGEGDVLLSTLGHDRKDFEIDLVRKIILNSVQWVCGELE